MRKSAHQRWHAAHKRWRHSIRWRQRLRRTLQAPGPWWLALSFAVYSGQWLAVIGFLPTIYALSLIHI